MPQSTGNNAISRRIPLRQIHPAEGDMHLDIRSKGNHIQMDNITIDDSSVLDVNDMADPPESAAAESLANINMGNRVSDIDIQGLCTHTLYSFN